MTQQPVRIESRVSAIERRQFNIEIRIEELAEDMTASFLKNAEHQVRLEQKIDALSEEMNARFTQVDARFNKIETDMGAMEGRILNAFQQLLTVIDQRLPEQKGE